MLRTTNESYQQMNGILTQIGDALVIPTNQPENRHIIQEILMQERLNNNNNNPKNEVNVPAWLVNDREQSNLVLVNKNQNANEVLVNMQ